MSLVKSMFSIGYPRTALTTVPMRSKILLPGVGKAGGRTISLAPAGGCLRVFMLSCSALFHTRCAGASALVERVGAQESERCHASACPTPDLRLELSPPEDLPSLPPSLQCFPLAYLAEPPCHWIAPACESTQPAGQLEVLGTSGQSQLQDLLPELPIQPKLMKPLCKRF
jgi:hypothetical protein